MVHMDSQELFDLQRLPVQQIRESVLRARWASSAHLRLVIGRKNASIVCLDEFLGARLA